MLGRSALLSVIFALTVFWGATGNASAQLRVYANPSDQTWNTSPDGTYNEGYAMQETAVYFVNKCAARGFATRNSAGGSLSFSCNDAVSWDADTFVSLHTNASGGGGWSSAHGTMGLYYQSSSGWFDPVDRNLCIKIVDQCINQFSAFGRGAMWGSGYYADYPFYGYNLYVLSNTPGMNSVLIEGLFHSNYDDVQVLKSTAGKQAYAEGAFRGVCDNYGYSYGSTPPLDSQFVNQSYSMRMTPGQYVTCWVEYRNTGSETWTNSGSNPVKLGTWGPQDRPSPFYVQGNWDGVNRPSLLDQPSVVANGVGRFTFLMKAPNTIGHYEEKFRLVKELVAWFGTDEVTFYIDVVPENDVIVDNTEASFTGTWSTGTSSTDKFSYNYRYAATSSSTTAQATFTPNLPAAGRYNVYVYYPQGANRSTSAKYTVNYQGGSETYSVNQQAGGGQWNLICTKTFSSGTSGSVVLSNNAPTGFYVLADAVRFEWVGPAAPDSEMRAYWVDAFHDGFKTYSQVDQLVDTIRASNMNTVFVQMRRRGDTYFDSNVEPLAPDADSNFDALDYLLYRAHNENPRIDVHAWIVTLPVWNSQTIQPPAGHVYIQHPDWLTQNSSGQTWDGSNYCLDPGVPGVQDHLAAFVRDLVSRYNVDGVHWDYIRYTGNQWGYNPVSISRFNAAYNRTGTPAYNDADWLQWRRDQVTALARRLYAETIAIKPQCKVSAATITWGDGPTTEAAWQNSSAYASVLQDWRAWLEEGILDINVPMTYYAHATYPTYWANWTNYQKTHKYGRHLVVGAGAWLNSVDNLYTQLESTRLDYDGHRAEGQSLYSYACPYINGWGQAPVFACQLTSAACRPEPFYPNNATVPSMPWKTTPANGHLYGSITDNAGAVDAATISVTGPVNRQIKSDGSGFYAFVELPPGNYAVTVTKLGYSNATRQITMTAGDRQKQDFQLNPPSYTLIVDNPDAAFSGTWYTATSAIDKYAANYHWISTNPDGTATATFRPNIPVAGYYHVYVWYSQGTNRSTAAPYTVNFQGGSSTHYVNQQVGGGQWNYLTTAYMPAGTSASVVLSNQAASGFVVIADAVKFQTASAPASLSSVKQMVGQNVSLSGIVARVHSDRFNIVNSDRTKAIAVVGTGAVRGKSVTLEGVVAKNLDDEVIINLSSIISQQDADPPIPLGMNGKNVGGAISDGQQPGTANSYGPNNIGCDAFIWGKITQKAADNSWMLVDDGSARPSGETQNGVRVIGAINGASRQVGQFVLVKGSVSVRKQSGIIYPVIRVAESGDILSP